MDIRNYVIIAVDLYYKKKSEYDKLKNQYTSRLNLFNELNEIYFTISGKKYDFYKFDELTGGQLVEYEVLLLINKIKVIKSNINKIMGKINELNGLIAELHGIIRGKYSGFDLDDFSSLSKLRSVISKSKGVVEAVEEKQQIGEQESIFRDIVESETLPQIPVIEQEPKPISAKSKQQILENLIEFEEPLQEKSLTDLGKPPFVELEDPEWGGELQLYEIIKNKIMFIRSEYPLFGDFLEKIQNSKLKNKNEVVKYFKLYYDDELNCTYINELISYLDQELTARITELISEKATMLTDIHNQYIGQLKQFYSNLCAGVNELNEYNKIYYDIIKLHYNFNKYYDLMRIFKENKIIHQYDAGKLIDKLNKYKDNQSCENFDAFALDFSQYLRNRVSDNELLSDLIKKCDAEFGRLHDDCTKKKQIEESSEKTLKKYTTILSYDELKLQEEKRREKEQLDELQLYDYIAEHILKMNETNFNKNDFFNKFNSLKCETLDGNKLNEILENPICLNLLSLIDNFLTCIANRFEQIKSDGKLFEKFGDSLRKKYYECRDKLYKFYNECIEKEKIKKEKQAQELQEYDVIAEKIFLIFDDNFDKKSFIRKLDSLKCEELDSDTLGKLIDDLNCNNLKIIVDNFIACLKKRLNELVEYDDSVKNLRESLDKKCEILKNFVNSCDMFEQIVNNILKLQIPELILASKNKFEKLSTLIDQKIDNIIILLNKNKNKNVDKLNKIIQELENLKKNKDDAKSFNNLITSLKEYMIGYNKFTIATYNYYSSELDKFIEKYKSNVKKLDKKLDFYYTIRNSIVNINNTDIANLQKEASSNGIILPPDFFDSLNEYKKTKTCKNLLVVRNNFFKYLTDTQNDLNNNSSSYKKLTETVTEIDNSLIEFYNKCSEKIKQKGGAHRKQSTNLMMNIDEVDSIENIENLFKRLF